MVKYRYSLELLWGRKFMLVSACDCYVISIKRVKDMFHKPLRPMCQLWEFFGVEKNTSEERVKPWLTESLNDAVKFGSEEDALKFFNENEHYLKYILSNEGNDCYDISSLGIRKIMLDEVEYLHLREDN